MAEYSIKDLEKISGIKAHTIRIWEQRYGVLNPHRTETNIRFYDDDHLKQILNISLMVENGLKISKISKLTTEDVREFVKNIFNTSDKLNESKCHEAQINSLVIAMLDLDEDKFDKIFSNAILRIGLLQTISKIIYPFLDKVGIMWGTNEINPAQEHFISNLIRQKIIVAIDALEASPKDSDKYLLFLQEGELHEIGLLMASYILKLHKKQVIYLGQNVPYRDILQVAKICNPQHIISFFIMPQPCENVKHYIESLTSDIKNVQFYFSGNPKYCDDFQSSKNIFWIKSMEFFIESLSN
jgi:DNA-binding transcriptional MerR regulator